MPRFFALVLACVLLLPMGACRSEGAKNGKTSPVQTMNDNGPAGITTGSFRTIATDSEEARTAFMFLKSKLSLTRPELTLDKLSGAEAQVVAGYNYRLVCDAHDGKGKRVVVTAVIYRNLDGVYRVTGCKFEDKKS
jgi:hypothetical protein